MHKPSKNEGEGSKTAAKQYNDAASKWANSGEVEESARKAAEALQGTESESLREAEEEGKKHAAEEDPELYSKE